MTQIFNGYADSGSYPTVDFYRVDIDNAQDVVQHVSGQTVRLDLITDRAHTDVLKHVLFLCWSFAHRSLAFMRTDVARNSASLLAHIPTDCRYARDAFFLLQNQ